MSETEHMLLLPAAFNVMTRVESHLMTFVLQCIDKLHQFDRSLKTPVLLKKPKMNF